MLKLALITSLISIFALGLIWRTNLSEIHYNYAYMCDREFYIISSTDDGWKLWFSPEFSVGTTHDGWYLLNNETKSYAYLRSVENETTVMSIENGSSHKTYECFKLY